MHVYLNMKEWPVIPRACEGKPRGALPSLALFAPVELKEQ